MSPLEVSSLVASVVSVVLAIVAIWLSFQFFRMSSSISENTKEAAKGIGSSVEKLEKLFEKLYADTFSMMRETVSDMRKHIWPDESTSQEQIDQEAERKTEAKLGALKRDVQESLSNVLKSQSITEDRLERITKEIGPLVERAMTESRKVEHEAREETIRKYIFDAILRSGPRTGRAKAGQIVNVLPSNLGLNRVLEEMRQMKAEELINYNGERIEPDTEVFILEPKRPRDQQKHK